MHPESESMLGFTVASLISEKPTKMWALLENGHAQMEKKFNPDLKNSDMRLVGMGYFYRSFG